MIKSNNGLVLLTILIYSVESKWGPLWCGTTPKSVENFDKNAFTGTWYEIFRDSDHDLWSWEKCSIANYKRYKFENKLTLER